VRQYDEDLAKAKFKSINEAEDKSLKAQRERKEDVINSKIKS